MGVVAAGVGFFYLIHLNLILLFAQKIILWEQDLSLAKIITWEQLQVSLFNLTS